MTVTYLLKGALVEYGAGLASVLPNVVLFQFNPEMITRTIEIPPRPSGASLREVNQAGEIPVEKISLTAHFSAQEEATRQNPIALATGIGPQLAALEKLVRPSGPLSGLIQKAVDKIGSLISSGSGRPGAAGAARGVPADAVRVGDHARAAGHHRLALDRREAVRRVAQPDARRGHDLDDRDRAGPVLRRPDRERRLHLLAVRARLTRTAEPG